MSIVLSTDEICRGSDEDLVLTDELDRMDTDITGLQSTRALNTHNHDDVYAPVSHTHSGYAASVHTHSEYAASGHTHSEYAAASHSHSEYAGSTHTHADKADLVNGVIPISQIPNEVKEVVIVANIAARNALTGLFAGLNVYVTDATGDSTVSSGGAFYLYDGTNWIKTGEAESMDVVLQWANVQGKPSALPADGGNADTVDGKHASDFATADHTHTAAGIGAAAANHTHSAADVGAATADHTHTAADVGAAAVGHTHTAADVGAAASGHSHTLSSLGAAAANHTHDYAASDHNHDTAYAAAGHSHTVDTALSDTSTNPVQNKVINAALAGKAASGHNHDTVYAGASHTHDYAASDHNHDSAYAASNHTHTPSAIGAATAGHTHTPASIGAAASSHTHSNYAASTHNHDSAYAAKSHTHSYAASDHNHDGDYLPASGNISLDGTLDVAGELDVNNVIRCKGSQVFYIDSAGTGCTIGTANATSSVTLAAGANATVNQSGANWKGPNTLPRASNTYTLGSTSLRWKGIYSNAAVNVSSDKRRKRGIRSLFGDVFIEFIKDLQVVGYNYIDDEADAKERIGLIAQDVQAADPDLAKYFVNENEDGMLSLTPADLVFPLIMFVQNQQEQIDELKSRIENLTH